MQKRKQQLFALALALWALSSCSQDASDVQGSATGGETVTFSLDAEVSVDDSELRAINYKLGRNAKSQLVPLPQFTDKQEVEVHTILKSSRGTSVAKTLKWRYDASKKRLVLKQTDGHSITVSGFNNDNATKWYISGLIGGALNGTKVEFMGTRVVKGVNGNAGDALGSMEVPYAFGWTELTINTKSTKEGSNSYKYAEVPKSKTVQFKPLGSMLAVKLGTNQSAGAYTFTPKGFVLSSNAWGDQGSFELSTTIPPTNPHTALPTWTQADCAGSMYYTFASGEEPGAIAHNQTTAKTYYVWVMPHKTVPTGAADVRVMLKGTSSRPEAATYKDYTNTWFTDYTTEGKATQGKVTQGRVHTLTAKVTRRVALPIEYVTEYNLAGGEGLTNTIQSGVDHTELGGPIFGGVQPAGVTGSLRFAASHRSIQSGYYNWYKVVGRYHATANPNTRNLQTEVDKTFGSGKYYVPVMDQWWSVFPTENGNFRPQPGSNPSFDRLEYMFVGSDSGWGRQSYLADYTSPISANNATSDATIYAIRFKAHAKPYCGYVYTGAWDYNATTNSKRSYVYPMARDNSLKCAYRFRRIGGEASWSSTAFNLDNQLIIDVVYLGEESTPTQLSTITNASWWNAQRAAGKLISRTFPATGYLNSPTISATSSRIDLVGAWGGVRSSSLRDASSSYFAAFTSIDMHRNAWSLDYGLPVRLFSHRPLGD